MNVKIKRFDKSILLPEYKTKGSVGLDMYTRLDMTIPAGKIGYIPLNVAVEFPDDCFSILASRGSTHKLGLILVNGIGIGDSDFKGDDDEYKFAGFNFMDKAVTIEKGTRIAQLLILSFDTVNLVEVDKMDNENRGSFGSTGNK
ncbi:MAG: dUTP diphosphatase [bacterium]|nr:dUTP diphosphatase [bacterium]